MCFPGDEVELAWGLIANAYGGDWDEATDEWRQAAVRWRDSFIGSGIIDGMDPNLRKATPINPAAIADGAQVKAGESEAV